MEFEHVFSVIDSHTAGQTTRIVTAGLRHIPGTTMGQKQDFVRTHYDHVRTALILEPRGHRDLFGALLVPPTVPEAHWGVLFIGPGRYWNMCGHGAIGIGVVAVKTGLVPKHEPITEVVLDTPAGAVRVKVEVNNGRVGMAVLENVPAFVLQRDVVITGESFGQVTGDVVFGGNFFVILDSAQVGLAVAPEHAEEFLKLGLAIRQAANEQLNVQHPAISSIQGIEEVMFTGEVLDPESDGRSVVILGDGQVDRSPCGTGTSARMALLHARGKLALGEEFVHESIIGTCFCGRLLGEKQVGDVPAVLPEIRGSAYITGFNTWVLEADDPLRHGFVLG